MGLATQFVGICDSSFLTTVLMELEVLAMLRAASLSWKTDLVTRSLLVRCLLLASLLKRGLFMGSLLRKCVLLPSL